MGVVESIDHLVTGANDAPLQVQKTISFRMIYN